MPPLRGGDYFDACAGGGVSKIAGQLSGIGVRQCKGVKRSGADGCAFVSSNVSGIMCSMRELSFRAAGP